MYHLDIFCNGVCVSTLYGDLDSLIYVVDNIKFSITYTFKFSKV